MPWHEILIHAFSFILMVFGLVGIVLPFFPGIPLIWFGVFLSAAATGFTKVDLVFVALVGVLTLLSFGLDFWRMRWGIKGLRVTPFGVVGGIVGGIVGSFFGFLPAMTVGPLIGSVLGEMVTGHESMFVIETDSYKIIGYVGSTLVKVTIALILIGTWAAKIL